jgi:hypothetical protein
MIITVDELIKELERYKGKEIVVSLGMTYKTIKDIEEEEEGSNLIYLNA